MAKPMCALVALLAVGALWSRAAGGSTSAPQRVLRSAAPIVVRSDDDPTRHNHLDALDGGRFLIQPSRTLHDGDGDGDGDVLRFTSHHHDPRRLAAVEGPPAHHPRQSNPDIQDIITGIVKLLNGNVNVQANTNGGSGAGSGGSGGRPLRPLSTRINNRGPPRIADVPALPPDFDVPSAPLPLATGVPLRVPSPYPFDLPPRPAVVAATKRPPGYRPMTIPPWSRPPFRRPFPPRRPTPIPTYKPSGADTDTDVDAVSLTSEQPAEDILTLDLGSEMSSSFGDAQTQPPPLDHDHDMAFERNKEKSASKMEKHSRTVAQEANATETIAASAPTTDSVYSTELVAPQPTRPTNSSASSAAETATAYTSIEPSAPQLTASESAPAATEALPASATPAPSATMPSSRNETETAADHGLNQSQSSSVHQYRPRPGIVLDDTEYKPGSAQRPPILTAPPPPLGQLGEIFDVTVSAIQGLGGPAAAPGHGQPYVVSVDLERPSHADVITSPMGTDGFVSIDGKRTYLNLFGEHVAATATSSSSSSSSSSTLPTSTQPPPPATPGSAEIPRRPSPGKRPTQPLVRIDTCIVGDDATCDTSQYEYCLTEAGVSSCHCRPGHARRKHREPCRKVVSLLVSLRVDRVHDRRVVWSPDLADRAADLYQQLSYEAERALDSAMSMTPFGDEFLGARVNGVYEGDRTQGRAGVFVNLTLQIEENAETSRANVRADIQRHLLGVIQRRSNNIGNSALWVDSPPGSVSNVQDVDECATADLNDCHQWARCVNTFGGFRCACTEGYRDPWPDSKHRAGRHCEQCPPAQCNHRGECRYEGEAAVCACAGNYYGAQCELDGEVLGVAIGASVAAVLIIGLTLVCLVMWSRRWNREQQAASAAHAAAAAAALGSPVFGYLAAASGSAKAPAIGGPPYQMTLEDRLRWAQIADAMAQTNHYAPEPVVTTRPSSAMFGYPAASMHGTLPPIPLPRLSIPPHGMRPLDNSSSSEEEDKADLLGRSFQVPRPKSRSSASVANQSGIYYDVEYAQNDVYKHPAGGIPMSTYTAGRHPFYRH